MADTVSLDDFADKLVATVREYTAEVEVVVADAVFLTAAETKVELGGTSPVGATGKYARGWRVKKIRGAGFTTAIIHNVQYPLVHLLEKGHALRNGGRSRAFPHVFPAQAAAEVRLIERITKATGGG